MITKSAFTLAKQLPITLWFKFIIAILTFYFSDWLRACLVSGHGGRRYGLTMRVGYARMRVTRIGHPDPESRRRCRRPIPDNYYAFTWNCIRRRVFS